MDQLFCPSSVENPYEYWHVSFHHWPCATGVASDVAWSPGLPLSRSVSFLCCAAMPALKQLTSSNNSKASVSNGAAHPH
eukprot:scaffold191344_cov18-Tisochrysis_lutea.AAC.1